jgi:hypothetical protein
VKTRWHTVTAAVLAGAVAAALVALPALAPALPAAKDRPLWEGDFYRAAPRGFGEVANGWAQSMTWWKDHLYVGTGRQGACTALFSIWRFVATLLGQEFADTWLPYPPRDPDLFCAADGADLLLQAEIWRWSPVTDTWLRVFQSPNDLDNPGTGPPAPPRVGKKLPYEITFRGMTAHAEPNGTSALYAFGVNATVMWDRNQLPPPRVLRSTDGLNFIPIPQTPGTFLGDFPFNPDHSSFRSPVSHEGKLFVLSGPVFGQGTLIGSADPARGDDAWFLGSPPELMFYEMASFNGWLYLGTFNPFGNGYSVVKTRTEGPPPYTFVTVVPGGAFLPERPSKSVVSMHVNGGRLYVGTGSQTELIRINPDDTWDLLVGPPRQVPRPNGGTEWKYPLSGLDAGFGQSLNDHAWQMDTIDERLYIGTFNASLASYYDPVSGPLLQHNMGAHLYQTRDGWYYNAVTTNGFADPSDPDGGRYDYGIRTMAVTPHGVFMGTVNDHRGLMVFRAGSRSEAAPPEGPERLEIEATRDGNALLSWRVTAINESYQIWRAEVNTILVRDEINFELWNGMTANKVPDTYIGPYQRVGESNHNAIFVDSTVEPGQRYMYYVTREYRGEVSEASNLVAFPLLTPPVTFAGLLQFVERVDSRPRLHPPLRRLRGLRRQILDAQSLAASCRITEAIQSLKSVKRNEVLLGPAAVDFEILLSKLIRRLTLFRQFRHDVVSDEFCPSPGPAPAPAATSRVLPRAR